MRTNHYETAIILNAGLDDQEIESLLEKVVEKIKNVGGIIHDTEILGRKRLAYLIDKHKSGFYAIYRHESPVSLIPELERFFRFDENVIRFLTIKLEKEALEYFKDRQSQVELIDKIVEQTVIPAVETVLEEEIVEEIEEIAEIEEVKETVVENIVEETIPTEEAVSEPEISEVVEPAAVKEEAPITEVEASEETTEENNSTKTE